MIERENITAALRRFFGENIPTPGAREFLRELQGDSSGGGGAAAADEDEVTGLMLLFADLADAGANSRGIAGCLKGLRDILNRAAEILDRSTDEQELIMDNLERFAALLKISPQRKKYQTAPEKNNNVIAFFLSKTRSSVLNQPRSGSGHNRQRWNRLCLAGYRATKNAVRHQSRAPEKINHDRAGKAEVAIGYVLRNLPEEAWFAETRYSLDPGEVTDAIRFAKIREVKTVKGRTVPCASNPVLNYYRRIAAAFFSDKSYNWKTYYGKHQGLPDPGAGQSAKKAEPPAPPEQQQRQQPRRYWIADQLDGDIYSRDELIEKEEGGLGTEFNYPPGAPTELVSPKGSAAWSLAFQPTELRPIWAKGVLTAETLGVVLGVLQSGAGGEGGGGRSGSGEEGANKIALTLTERLCAFFIQLQIFYGFSPGALQKMKSATTLAEIEAAAGASLFLLDGRIYISPQRENGENAYAAPYTDDRQEKHFKSQNWFSLPLLDFLRDDFISIAAATGCSAGDEIFGWREAGVFQKLTAKMLDRYLKDLPGLAAFSPQLISVSRIFYAVRALRTVELNRSKLLTAFLGGEIPRHLASQAHYTNYSQSELTAESAECQRETLSLLTEKSRDSLKLLGLPEIAAAKPSARDQPEAAGEELRIGSPFVAKADARRELLDRLETESRRHPNWRHRFNCRTALIAIKLMLYNGLRSAELKKLRIDRIFISETGSQIAVEAKSNQRFKEWRVIELSAEARAELESYLRASREALDKLNRERARTLQEITEARDQAFLFFIRRYDLPVPLAVKDLRTFLVDPENFPGGFFSKISFGRHVWRTTAVRLGLDEDVIDRQTGHTTLGREPLGVYSFHDWVSSNRLSARVEKELRKK